MVSISRVSGQTPRWSSPCDQREGSGERVPSWEPGDWSLQSATDCLAKPEPLAAPLWAPGPYLENKGSHKSVFLNSSCTLGSPGGAFKTKHY